MPGAVLLFDGIFLQRPELRSYWDLCVWLDGEQRVTDARIIRACRDCPPGPGGLLHLAWWWAVLGRYVGGMRRYVGECDPSGRAEIVIDNNDLSAPFVVTSRSRGPATSGTTS